VPLISVQNWNHRSLGSFHGRATEAAYNGYRLSMVFRRYAATTQDLDVLLWLPSVVSIHDVRVAGFSAVFLMAMSRRNEYLYGRNFWRIPLDSLFMAEDKQFDFSVVIYYPQTQDNLELLPVILFNTHVISRPETKARKWCRNFNRKHDFQLGIKLLQDAKEIPVDWKTSQNELFFCIFDYFQQARQPHSALWVAEHPNTPQALRIESHGIVLDYRRWRYRKIAENLHVWYIPISELEPLFKAKSADGPPVRVIKMSVEDPLPGYLLLAVNSVEYVSKRNK